MGTSSLTQNPHWLYSDSVATRVHFSVWQCWKYKTLQHARDGLYSWWGWSLGVVGCTIFVEPRFLKEKDAGVSAIVFHPSRSLLLPSHFPKPETLCLEYIKAVFSIVIHTRITHRR
ncbi:hypothetical protein YC2023_081382 [Brassica napus]